MPVSPGSYPKCGRNRAHFKWNWLMPFSRYTGRPMTLGNMRANGVRRLDVSCWQCHHSAVLDVDQYDDDMLVPSFGPRMVCTYCGTIGHLRCPAELGGPGWQDGIGDVSVARP